MPGVPAHQQLAPPGRLDHSISPQARVAAVLLLIYPQDGVLSGVLIERKAHPLDKHSGQISFPGGKMEAKDASYEACALREANEEIGLEINLVEVLGHLSSLYIPVSLFQVYPVVAWSNSAPSFVREPSEVEKIITFPIAEILGEGKILTKDLEIREGVLLPQVHHFSIKENIVWGATAMMMNELKIVLENADLRG